MKKFLPIGRRYRKGDISIIRVDGRLNKTFRHGAFRKSGYHPLAYRWNAMKQRCSNPKWINYSMYGGRGIKVCKRWMKIENFIADMYPTFKPGLFIDRKNNSKGYSKSNCRWVTRKQNNNNTRSNPYITFKGKRRTIAQWADYLGVKPRLINVRLWRGWSEQEALTIE